MGMSRGIGLALDPSHTSVAPSDQASPMNAAPALDTFHGTGQQRKRRNGYFADPVAALPLRARNASSTAISFF